MREVIFLTIRTDLAWECRELWQEQQGQPLPAGVRGETRRRDGCTVEALEVENEAGAAALGKPPGRYLTLFPEALLQREPEAFARTAALLGELLRELLPSGGSVLVVGLGNSAITPDELGPRTLRHVLATRHLTEALPEFRDFRPVAALTTGVLGDTGMESAELVRAVAEKLRPAAVVAVDALASRRLGRVCRTVQLTDTGISPGSGVGNRRLALCRESLGVPVVGLGVPTVVDAGTLAADLTAGAGLGSPQPEDFGPDGQTMIVTPREIDQRLQEVSRLLGYAIDLALHPQLTCEDITALMG